MSIQSSFATVADQIIAFNKNIVETLSKINSLSTTQEPSAVYFFYILTIDFSPNFRFKQVRVNYLLFKYLFISFSIFE